MQNGNIRKKRNYERVLLVMLSTIMLFQFLNRRLEFKEYLFESNVLLEIPSGELITYEAHKIGFDAYRFELYFENETKKRRLNTIRNFYYNELTLNYLDFTAFECEKSVYVTSKYGKWHFEDAFENFSDDRYKISFVNQTEYTNRLKKCSDEESE